MTHQRDERGNAAVCTRRRRSFPLVSMMLQKKRSRLLQPFQICFRDIINQEGANLVISDSGLKNLNVLIWGSFFGC